jgi:hypothetical protein
MSKVFIPVKVGCGVFGSERSASWQVNGENYETIVDQSDIVGDKLRVDVIEAHGDQVLIDLPRDCFVQGSRLVVPRSFLIVE